jgi:hypothetical protein
MVAKMKWKRKEDEEEEEDQEFYLPRVSLGNA